MSLSELLSNKTEVLYSCMLPIMCSSVLNCPLTGFFEKRMTPSVEFTKFIPNTQPPIISVGTSNNTSLSSASCITNLFCVVFPRKVTSHVLAFFLEKSLQGTPCVVIFFFVLLLFCVHAIIFELNFEFQIQCC